MSELFEEPDGGRGPQRSSRRTRVLVTVAGGLLVLFFLLTTFASLYTDHAWFDSAGFPSVFTTLFWTRAALFAVFGLLMAGVAGLNMVLAFRFRPAFRPASPDDANLQRYREVVNPVRPWLVLAVAGMLGIFAGTSASGQWRSYLLWRHGTSFGSKDAYFGKDIGFYVFDLPWLHYLVDSAMAFLFVALLVAALVHYLYGGIRLQTAHDRLSGAAQVHLSVLLGLFVLAKGADYWLDRFDLVTGSGGLVTGMTYTDQHAVLPAKNILMFIAVICAVLFLANIWRRTWLLPSVGLGLLMLSAILLGMIWPGVVQQFQVKPSEPNKEATYISRNIAATRAAYDLSGIDVQEYDASTSTQSASLPVLAGDTSTTPVIDPQLVHDTFEQVQQVRSYYSVARVLDVDRYLINGEERALVLGVRELNQNGISAGDRNWSNLHTVYTHGNGVIAAYANNRPLDDVDPSTGKALDIHWAEGQQAGESALTDLSPQGYQSKVYFGEESPDYSVVGKTGNQPDVELDLGNSDGTDKTTTYDGTGGVPVGSLFNRLMYAVKFGEPNFLLSSRVNANSQVLYIRHPRDRVEKVAPWLTVDSDPYPAVVDGRIQWIVDGYTTTDQYPTSQSESLKTMTDDSLNRGTTFGTLPTDDINYMRNAVKATVDAYDGTVKLYAWDETDPILRAWEQAFPGTVQPRAAIPPALMDHLRYPEDLFKVQRFQFARYHVTNANDFYQANNRWAVPEDPNSKGHLQPPYRLFVDQPTDTSAKRSTFSLTSVFTPYNKNNLAAFVSVDSDATSKTYGQMRVLQLPDQQTQGPGLVANDFASNNEVRSKLQPYQLGGAPPIFGNLLTLPVTDGLIYVEPVYAVRAGSTSGYPILQFVLVSYGGEVGIGRTLGESLADALNVTGGGSQPSGNNQGGGGKGGNQAPTGTVNSQIRTLLDRADRAFRQADAALRTGDTVTYAKKVQQAQALITRAVALADQQKSG